MNRIENPDLHDEPLNATCFVCSVRIYFQQNERKRLSQIDVFPPVTIYFFHLPA